MPVDNTPPRDRQRASRDRLSDSLAPQPPVAGSEDVVHNGTRPRHHFRRAAIFQLSGRGRPAILTGRLTGAQLTLPRQANNIEVLVSGPPRTQQDTSNAVRTRPPLRQVARLVDQIRRGLVERISVAATRLGNLPTPPRDIREMELHPAQPYRDTHRFGRHGWSHVEQSSTQNGRPTTRSDSQPGLPESTLDLFQSIDLFAVSAPRTSFLDRAREVSDRIGQQQRRVQTIFRQTVEARGRGCDVPRGKLFRYAMECRGMAELYSDVVRELDEMEAAEHDRTHSRLGSSSTEGEERYHLSSSMGGEERYYECPRSPVAGTESATNETEEAVPWRWRRHMDWGEEDDYPQEVCVHLPSQTITLPIEEVEAWILRRELHNRHFDHFLGPSSPPPPLHTSSVQAQHSQATTTTTAATSGSGVRLITTTTTPGLARSHGAVFDQHDVYDHRESDTSDQERVNEFSSGEVDRFSVGGWRMCWCDPEDLQQEQQQQQQEQQQQ